MEKAKRIFELLTSMPKGFEIITGESITGGMVASTLISVPGMSEFLKQSLIVYSDEAKTEYLGVDPELLHSTGAVSRPVIAAMLHGLQEKADLALATTGFAGPGGDVGHVFLGAARGEQVLIRELRIEGKRNEIREKATEEVLSMAIEVLEGFQNASSML